MLPTPVLPIMAAIFTGTGIVAIVGGDPWGCLPLAAGLLTLAAAVVHQRRKEKEGDQCPR